MALADDQASLTKYRAALDAIATGQSYEINGRSLSRANLDSVMKTIEWLERRIAAATDQTGGFGAASFGDPG